MRREGGRSRLHRRGLILGAGAGILSTSTALARAAPPNPTLTTPAFEALERRSGGRLGVYAIDQLDGVVQHRASEAFAMCSTFKTLLAAAVLEQVQARKLTLERRIPYGPADLLDYAPVTRAHAAEGAMSVADLAAAAVELSDNTAANLMLSLVGGPAGLTARLRAWGDPTTRLDRNEPTLNTAIPGDPRDTTTPMAMVETLRRLLFDSGPHAILDPGNRERLQSWMINCQTGAAKLRAGLPTRGIIGDKTGNNGHDTSNDVAFLLFPSRLPVLIAVYLTEAKLDQAGMDAIIAEAGRLAALELTDQAGKRGDPGVG